MRTGLSVLMLLLCGTASIGLAQQAPNGVPASAMSRQQALDRAAAYNAALKMLGASGGVVGPGGQIPGAPSGGAVQPPAAAPKGKQGKTASAGESLTLSRTLPLPGNAKAALAISDAAFDADPQMKAAADGHLIYTSGKGIPSIVCGLFQVTEIDLEAGEHAAEKDVDVGDDEFHITVHKGPDRLGEFDYLIIKPTVANVETTLTIGTNRRVYYFRLIATQTEHMARISFSYPEDEERRKKEDERLARERQAEAAHLAALAPNKEIKNWKYTLETHGRDAHFMIPLSVGDDGARTYIQLSQAVRKLGLPVLQITGATGPIPANSHWEENRLIVDALFDRGCLLQGVGGKQQRVCIQNETAKKGDR